MPDDSSTRALRKLWQSLLLLIVSALCTRSEDRYAYARESKPDCLSTGSSIFAEDYVGAADENVLSE